MVGRYVFRVLIFAVEFNLVVDLSLWCLLSIFRVDVRLRLELRVGVRLPLEQVIS